MKRLLSVVLSLVFVLGLVACGSANSANGNSAKEIDYIAINVSNCNYYLSIDDIYISTSSVIGSSAGANRRITIHGAVSGLYSDCSITFQYKYANQTIQKTLQLNAAGFASLEYTTASGKAQIVSCTGKLYL